MAKTASMYIRIDPEVKSDVEAIYSQYGMSITDVPNTETLAAIVEVQEMKRNPHLSKSFDSVEALFEDLNDDE